MHSTGISHASMMHVELHCTLQAACTSTASLYVRLQSDYKTALCAACRVQVIESLKACYNIRETLYHSLSCLYRVTVVKYTITELCHVHHRLC